MALSLSMPEMVFAKSRPPIGQTLFFQGTLGQLHLPRPVAKEPTAWFDPNTVQYDMKAIYSPDGKLTAGQWVCDFLIRQVYQRPTRSTVYKWLGNPCPFKHFAKKLGCSEYALVMIHRFGVVRGIFLGAQRLLRCNPITTLMGNLNDPLIRVN